MDIKQQNNDELLGLLPAYTENHVRMGHRMVYEFLPMKM